MVTRQLLRQCAQLAKLGDEAHQKLADICEEEVIPAGTKIFTDMEPAKKMYLLLSGEVILQHEMGSGQRRDVDTLHDGELFAWSALVEPFRYTTDATTQKDCRVLAFDASKIRQLCEEDHFFGHQFMREIAALLSNRLDSARVQLAAV